jgi:MoaA/NifB/PqqE/SkfB family radical SAM enzyme
MNILQSLSTTLDLKSKLYQQSLWPAVTKVAAGETLTAPFMVEIDPTSFCDLACPECVSNDLLNTSRFTTDRLIEMAYELVDIGVKAVIFVGGGEPLVHPAMEQVLEICGKGGMKIGIITNGTQLHKFIRQLSEYAEWVRVSVDASSPETFELFRPHRSGKNVFEKVIENMRELKTAGLRSLGYSFLLMARMKGSEVVATNYSEVFDAGVLAKSIGCDYLEIKPVFDPVTHEVCDQPRVLLDQLQTQLDGLRTLEDESFRVIQAQALIELVGGRFLAELYDYGKCHVSELRTLISPHGVYLCPLYRGKAAYSIGDPTRSSIREIWNSPERARLMNSVKPCRDCLPKCSRHLSNIEIDRIGKGSIPSHIQDDYDLFI